MVSPRIEVPQSSVRLVLVTPQDVDTSVAIALEVRVFVRGVSAPARPFLYGIALRLEKEASHFDGPGGRPCRHWSRNELVTLIAAGQTAAAAGLTAGGFRRVRLMRGSRARWRRLGLWRWWRLWF